MKNSMAVNVLFCIAILGIAGCNTSEPGPSEESGFAGKDVQSKDTEVVESIQAPLGEDFNQYVQNVEDKLDNLKYKHVKLVARVKQGGLEPEPQAALDTTLEALIKKREDVHIQIEALKTGNEKDLAALQLGMNLALEELAHSYEIALAQFSG